MGLVLGTPCNRMKLANFRIMVKKVTMTILARHSNKTIGKVGAIKSISIMVEFNMAKTARIKTRGKISIRKDLSVNRTREEIKQVAGTLRCKCPFSKRGKINLISISRTSHSTRSKENSRMLKDRDRDNKSNLWVDFNHKIVRSARCYVEVGLGKISHALSAIKSSAPGVVLDRSACGQTTI